MKDDKNIMTNSILETAESASAYAEARLEKVRSEYKKRKIKLMKISCMMIIVSIVLVFATRSWFTMSRSVEGTDASMTASDLPFEITMLEDTGTGEKEGIFKDPYHIKVHEENALYWEMTAENNLLNYNPPVDNEDPVPDDPGDLGIHPGTNGVISFNVIPKTESVNLNFDFEIIGYQASVTETDGKLKMTRLSDVAGGECDAAQDLLNGHILLFEHRSGTAGNYVYSTPICSNADMHRIMNRIVTGKNTENRIDIFWVWPNTLSTLVNASASGITTVPFCVDNDSYQYDSYSAITENIESYPYYYLKGASSSDTIDTKDGIGKHYSAYGDMYDQGDNEIGMRVHYLLIKLSVTQGTAVGGGS